MRSGNRPQGGFTYIAILFAVAAAGLVLAGVGEMWSHARQREKEAELLWVGEQFREAIGLYYQRSPGSVKRYPQSLQDLLEDKRHLSMQRYLRKIYVDPMTGKAEWGLLPAPGGGIAGVYSLSRAQPLKTGKFPVQYREFQGLKQYSDWRFSYLPPK
ncbi:MAG: type II secretion system protein [Betaproteobacteria bacterium]|jgi:type II secretory pathway pseudopilin PulG|nr:type II secretion system protein [Betaproteobacteria bacterium]